MLPMGFTFRQLEIFVQAASDGSFRRTADKLGISQPAISRQIRLLEERLGKTLFLRTRGVAVTLSDEGRALLGDSQEILAQQDRLRRRPASDRLHLKVATGEYLLNSVIRPVLPELHRRFPRITFEFQQTPNQKAMPDLVRTGRIDLAIYTGDLPAHPDPDSVFSRELQCALYAAPRLAAGLAADPAKIVNAPFVLPSSPPVKAWALRTLRAAGLQPGKVVAESQFWGVLATMIGDGVGIGLLFEDHAATCPTDTLACLPIRMPSTYRVMIVGEQGKRREARACIDFLKKLTFGTLLPIETDQT
jgi:DNA-binding transcriptional LysR family regulator